MTQGLTLLTRTPMHQSWRPPAHRVAHAHSLRPARLGSCADSEKLLVGCKDLGIAFPLFFPSSPLRRLPGTGISNSLSVVAPLALLPWQSVNVLCSPPPVDPRGLTRLHSLPSPAPSSMPRPGMTHPHHNMAYPCMTHPHSLALRAVARALTDRYYDYHNISFTTGFPFGHGTAVLTTPSSTPCMTHRASRCPIPRHTCAVQRALVTHVVDTLFGSLLGRRLVRAMRTHSDGTPDRSLHAQASATPSSGTRRSQW